MEDLPKYYTTIFNAVTDAIELLARSKVEEAAECLIAAQQKAEDLYISESSKPPVRAVFLVRRWRSKSLPCVRGGGTAYAVTEGLTINRQSPSHLR